MQATVVVPITFSGFSTTMRGSSAAAVEQGLDAEVDAGRDRAAAIAAVLVDDVEGGGGAEVDDDQRRPGNIEARADRIADPVGARARRP